MCLPFLPPRCMHAFIFISRVCVRFSFPTFFRSSSTLDFSQLAFSHYCCVTVAFPSPHFFFLLTGNSCLPFSPFFLLIGNSCLPPSPYSFFCSSLLFSSHFSLSFSLPARNSDPGSRSRLFSPLPSTACAFGLIVRRRQPFLPSWIRIELRIFRTFIFVAM